MSVRWAASAYRSHTRFVITPTGPLHLGHCVMAWWNKRLALDSGGTFTVRFESLLAMNSGKDYIPRCEAVCRENLAELVALGLGPTPPQELQAQGFPAGVGVCYQERHDLAAHYWKLWGLQELYGVWPGGFPEGAEHHFDAVYLSSKHGPSVEHPYVVLTRVVEDLATGRNVIIRGEGLKPETALYNHFAYRILRDRDKLPTLAYLPELFRRPSAKRAPKLPDGKPNRALWGLSSSNGKLGNGLMTLQDVIRAGFGVEKEKGRKFRPLAELWEFFYRRFMVLPSSASWTAPATLLNAVRPESPLVLDDEEWEAFLKGGG